MSMFHNIVESVRELKNEFNIPERRAADFIVEINEHLEWDNLQSEVICDTFSEAVYAWREAELQQALVYLRGE